ncbi:hypothetical protein [Longimicrobium sp.]|uniref:hypothetical protein n=1 Tax=Longimicrobium sp. TaxID=2029185 RepID=UPI002E3215EC|nr:hypothetical protein [Longimicrobium sp.]HEX6037619.1 hypothetical protein [Longimicrobium sp.]
MNQPMLTSRLQRGLIISGAIAFAIVQQFWMYGTFATPLEQESRLVLTRTANIATVLTVLTLNAVLVLRAHKVRFGLAARLNGIAAGAGSLLGAVLTSIWAPDLVFQEGFSASQLLSILISSTVLGLATAVVGVAVVWIFRLFLGAKALGT